MTAREVDEAEARLLELRTEAVGNFVLATVAFALALAASVFMRSFALPLLAGGLGATVLGVRAFLRRCFLLDDLSNSEDR